MYSYRGRDVFTFYVSDGKANSQPARVEILVTSDPEVSASYNSFTLIFGDATQQQDAGVILLSTGVFRIDAPGVLANDRVSAGATPTLRVTSNPKNGRFQLRQDGSVFYLPSTGFAGTDGFTYSLSAGQNSATARVRLVVVDKRAPELRFDVPRDGAVLQTVSEIRGRVRDRQSGLQTITLLWQRFDGKFWNGLRGSTRRRLYCCACRASTGATMALCPRPEPMPPPIC